jgi:menaquinone-9 beta-reductase
VLASDGYQPPEAPLSRGLEVHPHAAGGEDLDVWIERDLVPRGYLWRVPANGEQRVGAGSYDPRHHVKAPTQALAERLDFPAVRYQGNWFPHRLREAAEDGVFFVGDSAGHCFPLSGEGIRTAFYFGIACGRELRAVHVGDRTRAEALEAYAAFSRGHARAFRRALRLQRLIPALPPRLLTALLALMGRQPIVDRAFGWYLDQAHPDFAARSGGGGANGQPDESLTSHQPASIPSRPARGRTCQSPQPGSPSCSRVTRSQRWAAGSASIASRRARAAAWAASRSTAERSAARTRE